MCVIVCRQIVHVNPTCIDTHAWESVQTCRLRLIGQGLVVVQTGRSHADDACASPQKTFNYGSLDCRTRRTHILLMQFSK